MPESLTELPPWTLAKQFVKPGEIVCFLFRLSGKSSRRQAESTLRPFYHKSHQPLHSLKGICYTAVSDTPKSVTSHGQT